MSPFGSQNAFIPGKMLCDYMMFPHVGRMDDIWPSYYAQAKGWKVVYNRASVYQQRNAHDLTRDLHGEYIGYENNLQLVQSLTQDRGIHRSVPAQPPSISAISQAFPGAA